MGSIGAVGLIEAINGYSVLCAFDVAQCVPELLGCQRTCERVAKLPIGLQADKDLRSRREPWTVGGPLNETGA